MWCQRNTNSRENSNSKLKLKLKTTQKIIEEILQKRMRFIQKKKKKKKEKKNLGLISSIPFLYPVIKIFFVIFCIIGRIWSKVVQAAKRRPKREQPFFYQTRQSNSNCTNSFFHFQLLGDHGISVSPTIKEERVSGSKSLVSTSAI